MTITRAKLEQLWNRDPAIAVLTARKHRHELPSFGADVAHMQGQQQAFNERMRMQDSVNTQLGMMGISPGPSNLGSMPMPDPNEFTFASAMMMVEQNTGASASHAQQRTARALLTGQISWADAAPQLSATNPFEAQQLQQIIPMLQMMGMTELFAQIMRINAATMVAESSIDELLDALG